MTESNLVKLTYTRIDLKATERFACMYQRTTFTLANLMLQRPSSERSYGHKRLFCQSAANLKLTNPINV